MSLAMSMYVSDGGAYPFYDSGDAGPMGRTWESSLLPYLSVQKANWNRQSTIFLCPSDSAFESGLPGLGYGYNARGMATSGASIPLGQLGLGGVVVPNGMSKSLAQIPQRESAIVAPSEMIALGDAFSESKGKVYRSLQEWLGINLSVVASLAGGVDSQKQARDRHNSKCNVGFSDGHVAGAPFRELFADSETDYQRWNVDHQPHSELRVK